MRDQIMLPIIALAAALLSGAAIAAPPIEPPADVEPIATLMLDAAAVRTLPVSETMRGVIDSVDQANDTVEIKLFEGRAEFFRVQDGLVFDAVRFGDLVEISVQTIAGARTIVRLSKE